MSLNAKKISEAKKRIEQYLKEGIVLKKHTEKEEDERKKIPAKGIKRTSTHSVNYCG